MKIKLGILFLLVHLYGFGQESTKAYERYTHQFVWFADLGYSTAPFSVKIPEQKGIQRLTLRNNSKMILGIGFSYKWLTLRISSGLLGNLRPLSRYGKTQYFDFGVDFTVKKRFYFDIDFHNYDGYTYKNAKDWNDTLNDLTPNLYKSNFSAASFSVNTWHFFTDEFNMPSFKGKTGAYKRDLQTFYIRYTTNLYGIGCEQGIVPTEMRDTNKSITNSTTMGAFDFGAIPGYALVRRYKNMQFGVMGGVGATVQLKYYITPDFPRSYLGLAPRVDFKLTAGWNEPRWFGMLVTDFDNKGIRFRDMKYRQTFYTVKFVAGIRLNRKEKRKKLD